MPEFVGFVAEKSGVNKPALLEQDILIHRLLKALCDSPGFAGKYVFKGGSCLVKCYFGYYRFSVDLDFTWKDHGYLSVGGKARAYTTEEKSCGGGKRYIAGSYRRALNIITPHVVYLRCLNQYMRHWKRRYQAP